METAGVARIVLHNLISCSLEALFSYKIIMRMKGFPFPLINSIMIDSNKSNLMK